MFDARPDDEGQIVVQYHNRANNNDLLQFTPVWARWAWASPLFMLTRSVGATVFIPPGKNSMSPRFRWLEPTTVPRTCSGPAYLVSTVAKR